MTTNILETISVIDYPAIIKQIKAEAIAEGRAEAFLGIACNAFKQREKGIADSIIIENLLSVGIPEEIIRVVQNQI